MVARERQGHHVRKVPLDEGTQGSAARFLVRRARVKEQDLMVWTACACVTGAGGQTLGQLTTRRTGSDDPDAHGFFPRVTRPRGGP